VIIRPAQVAAFQETIDQQLEARVTRHVQEKHAPAVSGLTLDEIATRIRKAVSDARSYGLRTEADLTFFSALSFEFGPRFHEQSHIHSLLADPNLPHGLKSRLLLDRTMGEDWREAAALSTPR
jgi:hypothetical protein